MKHYKVKTITPKQNSENMKKLLIEFSIFTMGATLIFWVGIIYGLPKLDKFISYILGNG